jgi:hypothetical protein
MLLTVREGSQTSNTESVMFLIAKLLKPQKVRYTTKGNARLDGTTILPIGHEIDSDDLEFLDEGYNELYSQDFDSVEDMLKQTVSIEWRYMHPGGWGDIDHFEIPRENLQFFMRESVNVDRSL